MDKDPQEEGLELLEGAKIVRFYRYEVDRLQDWLPEGDKKVPNIPFDQFRQELPSPAIGGGSDVEGHIEGNTRVSMNRGRSDSAGASFQQYNKIISDDEYIVMDLKRDRSSATEYCRSFVRAGPRETTYFAPREVKAAIVTCGGLCPGLNNVIRDVTLTLYNLYGAKMVYGIRGGYTGFHYRDEKDPMAPVALTPESVRGIHHEGGSILGCARGGFDIDVILKFCTDKGVSQLYIIGGDGTHRGAHKIHLAAKERGLQICVAGVPKTIDNDVGLIDRSFGFNTAVEIASQAILSAKTEAKCNFPNGIGIVKLMGRSAGFIAAHASLSNGDVNLCLIPEAPIVLEGELGCLPHLARVVEKKGHAVVVVAEGAGEELLGESVETDAGGNKKLPPIGIFMKEKIVEYFKTLGKEATVKYIDPSYLVRSVPANASDSMYCMLLGVNAVHGAMAGYTGFSIGMVNNRMVLIPIPSLTSASPRCVDKYGRTWERILSMTRQPNTVPPKN